MTLGKRRTPWVLVTHPLWDWDANDGPVGESALSTAFEWPLRFWYSLPVTATYAQQAEFLFEASAANVDRKLPAGEHDVPGQSKPGGDTRQVLLRDTDIVELTRMLRAELVEHGEPQVPGQQHDPRVLVRSLHQAVNERGSHAERSSSASARSYSSPFGVR